MALFNTEGSKNELNIGNRVRIKENLFYAFYDIIKATFKILRKSFERNDKE